MASNHGQLSDAVTQLTTLMDIVVERVEVVRRLVLSPSDGEVEGRTSRRGKAAGPKTRTRSRGIEDEAVLDYFRAKGPMSVKGLAKDLQLTSTMAHKKVATLLERKALKKVKEGNRVMYMITPRGKKARKSATGEAS